MSDNVNVLIERMNTESKKKLIATTSTPKKELDPDRIFKPTHRLFTAWLRSSQLRLSNQEFVERGHQTEQTKNSITGKRLLAQSKKRFVNDWKRN